MENKKIEQIRQQTRELAARYIEQGRPLDWFEDLYTSAAGDNEQIPWADLEPNRFLVRWAEKAGLEGGGRSALVIGCGLGDDALYLEELGFRVTAFDVSPAAIEWAKRLHADTRISFYTLDLFDPPRGWEKRFDLVLEVYTIQALPLEMRRDTIDAISRFVAPGGELIVVARARETDEPADELPWGLSPEDLARFEENGLVQKDLTEMADDEMEDESGEPVKRIVALYEREG